MPVTTGTGIHFGTDGWRALVAEEFTFANVRAVAQGVAEYLMAHRPSDRPLRVIVGHDTRPLGDQFAVAVAEVLAGHGITVLMPPDAGVLYRAQAVDGIRVVGPVQLYLDLIHDPARGREQAEFLRSQRLRY